MSDDAVPTSSKPKSSREDALTVLTRLRDNGHVAYFAGGCVRDMLLGIEPKDYDVATDAPPEKVRRLFSNTQSVGAAFGVILVRLGGSQIEVATFRADLNYVDGRHPEGVRFTTAEEDAKRRDFTINALFFDPIQNEVIDFVGGKEDLRAQLIRAVGVPSERFAEDHLRILRAIRFAARYGFEIEKSTSEAIATHSHELVRITPERIADELRLMFQGPDGPEAWWDMFREYPAIANVIFRFDQAKPIDRNEQSNPGIVHCLPWETGVPFGLALAGASLEWMVSSANSWDLAPHLTKERVQSLVRALRQSLRISNEECEDLEESILGIHAFVFEQRTISKMKRFLAKRTAPLTRALLFAVSSQIGANVTKRIEQELSDLEKTDYAPIPFVTGDDLVAQGLKPGRLFKRVLDAVYDAQLEDRVKTKDEALALAMKIAAEG